jgi:alkyldihydroxyacetonephosphate synthase
VSETDASKAATADHTVAQLDRPDGHAVRLNSLDPAIAAEEVDSESTSIGSDLWPFGLKYPHRPAGLLLVCRPSTTEAVAAVLTYASGAGLTVLVVGGGSNVVGALDTRADILLSTERLVGVRDLDDVSQVVTVGAGTNAAELEAELTGRGLTLGIYPQSLRISTIGGWVATRATGTYSARYGGVEKSIVGAVAVSADGGIHRIGPRVRPGGGLDALSLLLGTEGSLAVVTEVTLAVRRVLDERRIAASFPTFEAGLRAQRELVQRELPIGLLRLYNERESDVILPADLAGTGIALLSVTVTGEGDFLDAAEAIVVKTLAECGGSGLPSTAADSWFDHRYSAETLMQTRNEPPLIFFDTIEVSVPWSGAEEAAAELEATMPGRCTTFHMHSSHVYPTGTCLYMILYIDGTDEADLRSKWDACWTGAIEIVQRHGGTFGHHHGVGTLRAGYYAATADGQLHTTIKSGLDPHGTLRTRSLEPSSVLDAPHGW